MNDGSTRERSDWTLSDRAADLACAAEVAVRARWLATGAALWWLIGLLGWACGASRWPWASRLRVEDGVAHWEFGPLRFLAEAAGSEWTFGRGCVAFFAGIAAWLLVALTWVVVARAAALELSRGERISLGEAFRFAGSRGRDWLGASALAVAVAAATAGVLAVVGLLLNWSVTAAAAWLLAPLLIVLVVVSAYALAGLVVATPLAWSAVSVDCSDPFDALTRGYSYAFQRPLGAVLHAVALVVVGATLWGLVAGAGWWVDAAAISLMERMLGENASAVGTSLVALLRGLLWLVVHAFAVSFTICGATWFYLWRRCDIDDASPDEFRIDDAAPNYELPPLTTDESPAEEPADPKAPAADEGKGEADRA